MLVGGGGRPEGLVTVRLGGGDDAGFTRFVSARTPALLRSAYLLTGDQQQAEDLVQTALVRIAPRWGRISARGDVEPYVRTVLYREHVSAWRRHPGTEVVGLDSVPEPRVAGHEERVAVRVSLARALDRLAPRQRAVVVLRFFEDLSEAATAEVLGCSVGTVRSQTAKALHRLRDLVPELLEGVRQ